MELGLQSAAETAGNLAEYATPATAYSTPPSYSAALVVDGVRDDLTLT